MHDDLVGGVLAGLLAVAGLERVRHGIVASSAAASRLAVSIWLVGDVRCEVKAPRPAAS
jgi:hypothetical protein